MLIKKKNIKKIITPIVISIILLIIFTAIFKIYHDTGNVKAEYERICPQNYGDPISLERCYWPFEYEGSQLDFALKTEAASLFIVPLVIYIAALL